jgi:ribosomal protein S8
MREFTYKFTEELCEELDRVLTEIANAENLYSVNTAEETTETKCVRILLQHGFIVDQDKTQIGAIFYKLNPPLGGEFYRNGGFMGERQRNIQALKDKKADFKLRVFAIVTSLIGGGLAGAITTFILKSC